MKQIYIVIEDGCLRYVSTDSEDVINNLGVTVIDKDVDDYPDNYEEDLNTAEKCVRIW